MDRYTPCSSRPTEVHARRRRNMDRRGTGYHETVLHHFSGFIEYQESSINQLMRNFDIDLAGDANCDRVITDPDRGSFSGPFDRITPSYSPKLPFVPQLDKRRPMQPSPPVSRPGRLSPATIQMVLSSNTSIGSGISSAADTSYDSGLYQWLGVEVDTGSSKPKAPPALSGQFLDEDSSNIDMSMMSSRSAYSQPSAESQIVLPLSPPATACPPFSDTLGAEQTSLLRILDPPSPQASLESIQKYDSRDPTTPMLSNNLSLQHYMPSASVLRRFQQVIDELRELYVPNDTGNNTPNPHRAQMFTSTRRSLPGSYVTSPSRVLPRLSSGYVTQVQSDATRLLPPVENSMYRNSRTTRELYTEMAVMLFTQVENEEAQITNFRNLVNRLESLASRKRKAALVIGTWGRERY